MKALHQEQPNIKDKFKINNLKAFDKKAYMSEKKERQL